MNHHRIDSSNTSCTVLNSPSGDSSGVSYFIDTNLVAKKIDSEASHSAEMVSKLHAQLQATERASAQRYDSEYDENGKSPAKRGRSTPRGRPITLENVNSDRTRRSASVASREKTRAMIQKPVEDFEDQESSQEQETAADKVKNVKEVKKVQASNLPEKEDSARKRHKKNDSKDESYSLESVSSAPSLKCSLPIGPIKGRGKKEASAYDNLKKYLPNNVRIGVDQILNSVHAQTLNVQGIEFDELEVEIRMEEEVEEGEVDQSEKGEGETTQTAGVDETTLLDETVQRQNAENTERQRSNNSPSSSSEATRVETNALAKRSQQTVLQKFLSDAVKDFGREHFESEMKEQIKKAKLEELLPDLMKEELQKYISNNAGGLLSEFINSSLNSSFNPSDELVEE